MFGRSFHLFDVFGFRIRVDLSWFLIAILVAWMLAEVTFPSMASWSGDEPSTGTFWLMGIAGALLLFASVLLHELAHAVVARGFGIEMRGITLFIFGGVAEMTDEPPSAQSEFQVAIAGPVASFLLAFLFAGAAVLGIWTGLHGAILVVLFYLALLNALLAVFNLIPAFPLDGGRVLRSVLWYWWEDLKRATRITSFLGSGFGLLLVFLGIVGVLSGDLFAIWWALIGLFVRNAAQMSYQQLLLRRVLEGEPEWVNWRKSWPGIWYGVRRFFAWLETTMHEHLLLPSSPFTKAGHYALERKEALRVFLEYPNVPVDTNHLEREIRPIAVGRKNWLFCWTELGAHDVGVIQSLLASCRLQGVDPYVYLVDVLQRIATHPAKDVHLLTPRLWKENFATNPLRSDLDLLRKKNPTT